MIYNFELDFINDMFLLIVLYYVLKHLWTEYKNATSRENILTSLLKILLKGIK